MRDMYTPEYKARLAAACQYLGLKLAPNAITPPDPGEVLIAIAEKLQQLEANQEGPTS